MRIVISEDILHAKANKLLANIGLLKVYIDDILILNKGNFAGHVEQLRICSSLICQTGLKMNA